MKEITIVAASDLYIKETINALKVSSKVLKPYKTILFTSNSYLKNKKNECILFEKIKPLRSKSDYSKFLIFELYKYIKTSHVLIVQWDGFIINSNKWRKDFLLYDYIGAPFIPRIKSLSYSRDLSNDFYTIGNGGFSLRSKKLIEAPSKYNLFDNEQLTNSNEDGFFCVLHRKFLESKGFKWAPFNIAKEFSIESPLNISELIDLPFGFHGRKLFYFIKIKKLLRKFKFTIFFINKIRNFKFKKE